MAYGNPGRAVVSINGDGGFGWGMQELATASKYGLKPSVVVFNDGHFGNVKRALQDQFGGPHGTDLHNPKFDRLAEAFDVGFAQVDTPADLEKVLKRSLGSRGDADRSARRRPAESVALHAAARRQGGRGVARSADVNARCTTPISSTNISR